MVKIHMLYPEDKLKTIIYFLEILYLVTFTESRFYNGDW